MAGLTPARLGVLIVDDDPLVRSGLRMILSSADDLHVVGEAGDGLEAVEQVTRLRPEIVLMDIRMPERDGIEAGRLITARPDPPRLIMLTTFDAADYISGAMAAGAAGFLLKDTSPALIVDAVRRVAHGEPMLSPRVTSHLMRSAAEQARPGGAADAVALVARLTDRELEVAVAVARGLSNTEVAAELFMSTATVKVHLSRVLTKLGLANRVQVAVLVHRAGLL